VVNIPSVSTWIIGEERAAPFYCLLSASVLLGERLALELLGGVSSPDFAAVVDPRFSGSR
jgi:hypothetical protein